MTYNLSLILIINPRNVLSTVLLVLFFELNSEIFCGQWPGIFVIKAKRFGSQKHSVRFKMIRKDESSRQPRI